MKREPNDPQRPEREIASLMASLVLHALAALLLVSLATSSMQEAAPEMFRSGPVLTVSVAHRVPARPIPHPRAVRVSAAGHPRVLRELTKVVPSASPRPTPAPVTSPRPILVRATTAPQIAVTAAPLVAVAPAAATPAPQEAVRLKARPTAKPAPSATPKPVPSATPKPVPSATPRPVPSATPKPMPSPRPKPSPIPSPVAVAAVSATPAPTVAPRPTVGPREQQSPGPKPVAPVKGPQITRPLHPPAATPHPAAQSPRRRSGGSLNTRLRSLIPQGAPVTPQPPKNYDYTNHLAIMPPQPTPPPEILAKTKFTFEENVGTQRWKQSWFGTAPEERYVKMYVISVKRIGPISWCTGWVVRSPERGNALWIVDGVTSFICAGHLEPFTPPDPHP